MKRQIKVAFLPTGEVKINNAGNPDEKRILAELEELAAILSGNKSGYQVEQHVHTHGRGHELTHDHQHTGAQP